MRFQWQESQSDRPGYRLWHLHDAAINNTIVGKAYVAIAHIPMNLAENQIGLRRTLGLKDSNNLPEALGKWELAHRDYALGVPDPGPGQAQAGVGSGALVWIGVGIVLLVMFGSKKG